MVNNSFSESKKNLPLDEVRNVLFKKTRDMDSEKYFSIRFC